MDSDEDGGLESVEEMDGVEFALKPIKAQDGDPENGPSAPPGVRSWAEHNAEVEHRIATLSELNDETELGQFLGKNSGSILWEAIVSLTSTTTLFLRSMDIQKSRIDYPSFGTTLGRGKRPPSSKRPNPLNDPKRQKISKKGPGAGGGKGDGNGTRNADGTGENVSGDKGWSGSSTRW